MNKVYLSLGGNLNNRRKNLVQACSLIMNEIGTIQIQSMVYETEAWGFDNAPAFYNQVIFLTTELSPQEILKKIVEIESGFGRIRSRENKYISRVMDIDILFYNNEVIDLPGLKIPHPSLHLRKFILVPLNEISPDLLHPVLLQPVKRLLQECSDDKWVKPVSELM